MNKLYKFGPVVFELRDFSNNELSDMWQWRLDPYRTNESREKKISVNLNKSNQIYNCDNPLHKEPSGFYEKQIFACDNGTVWKLTEKKNKETKLSLSIDKDWKIITLDEDNTNSSGQAAFEFISRIVLYAMIDFGVLPFHGVLLEHEGKGIIISAPSETGKTTHARLWRDCKNALIINGDNACCYKKDGKWRGFGIPWSGTSGESVNREVDIKAIVVLERGEENEAFRLNDYDAFAQIMPSLHSPSWDYKLTETVLDSLTDFMNNIPVFKLRCRPDEESVDVLKNALEELR